MPAISLKPLSGTLQAILGRRVTFVETNRRYGGATEAVDGAAQGGRSASPFPQHAGPVLIQSAAPVVARSLFEAPPFHLRRRCEYLR